MENNIQTRQAKDFTTEIKKKKDIKSCSTYPNEGVLKI